MQSLESVYDGQVIVATQSPVVLAVAKPEHILVFAKTQDEGTRIIPGDKHPSLRQWKGEVSLGTLFASGVLG
jgi:hypothetical protein